MSIYNVHEVVEQILVDMPQTRNSDVSLYLAFCERVNPSACHMEFATVFLRRRELGLPNFESVGRVRRKIQEERADLRATSEVIDRRYDKWKEYREYAAQ